MLRFNLRTSEH